MLAALSGCQKEEEIAGQEFNPISRLEAEKLIKGWNADRKGTLKSATTITITEGMWQKAKVSFFMEEQTNFISIPFTKKITIIFGDKRGCKKLFFLEARPSVSESDIISAKTFTGYVVAYDSKLAPMSALRY